MLVLLGYWLVKFWLIAISPKTDFWTPVSKQQEYEERIKEKQSNSLLNGKVNLVIIVLLIIAYGVYLYYNYKIQMKRGHITREIEKLYVLSFSAFTLNSVGLLTTCGLSNYEFSRGSLNQIFLSVVGLHVAIMRNKALSNLLWTFTAAKVAVIGVICYGHILSIENFDILIWGVLAKFIIHQFEFDLNKDDNQADETNNIKNSISQIIDNIPSWIMFCTQQGIVKTNKFWLQMKSKLDFELAKKCDREFYNSSLESLEIEESFELLKYFQWIKNSNLSLKDIVWNIVGKDDLSLDINIHDTFNVFNFDKNSSNRHESYDKILSLTDNLENLHEITVKCNLLVPSREFNAYICKMSPVKLKNKIGHKTKMR